MYYDIYGNELSSMYDIHGNKIWESGVITKLRKDGNNLVDAYGNIFQLRGIGTHAILQYQNMHTKEMFEYLKSRGINCIRVSVYISDTTFAHTTDDDQRGAYTGYINSKSEHDEEIQKIVAICVEVGLYVILDWHTMYYDVVNGVIAGQDEAIAFFEKYAQMYADVPNVLYELQNEPYNAIQASLGAYVKAERDAITQYVTNPVMIVGSRGGYFGNTVSYVEAYGVTDVFYSEHYYSDNLTASLMSKKTMPFICTEWSNASEASGATGGNEESLASYMQEANRNKISHCAWKLTDQNHVFSILKNRGSINDEYYRNGFDDDDLTEWGKLFFKYL